MVAIYPRQSVFKKDSLSIEQQVQRCISMCDANDWDYKVYDKDMGYSGKDMKRPSFTELMADVRSGKVDKILCYKFDRISRNISDFSNLMVELQKYNCEFISISENFDTTTPIGRAMVYICMVFAQMERENISQRIHDNYYYRTELGFWGGGTAPYGYKLARIKYKGKMHTVLEPDKDTAKIVKNIYSWYLEPTGSASTILHKLNNELCIPSRKGAKWTSRVLMDILSKPLYAPNDMDMYNYLTSIGANISNNPEEFDGKASIDLYGKKGEASKHKRCRDASDMYCNISSHDALIDSKTWIRVQHKRLSLLRTPNRSGTGKNSYFTGLMKCDCCGRGVSYTNSRGTQGYYICSSRKNLGWNSCDMKPAPKKTTDPVILEKIIEHYSKVGTINKINQAKIDAVQQSPSDLKIRNSLLSELASIENQIENLMKSLATGNDILAKYVNDKIVDLDLQKKKITNKLTDLDIKESTNLSDVEEILKIGEVIHDIPNILEKKEFEKTKELCKILVKRIVFKKDGRIAIEFTI